MAEEKERRKLPRREVKWPVTVLTDEGTIEGETRNITVEGVSINCDEPLPMNKVFRMGIIPPGNQMIEFTCKVVWSDLYAIGADDSSYGMGICYAEISDEDRHVLQKLLS